MRCESSSPSSTLARRSSQRASGLTPFAGTGERAEQHLVVERVGDRLEQPQEVLDLLLRPVAAAADDVGVEAGALERLLVGVDVGERPQQDDDLAGPRLARVDDLAQPPRDDPRLGDELRLALRRRRLEQLLVLLPSRSSSPRRGSATNQQTFRPFLGFASGTNNQRSAHPRLRLRGRPGQAPAGIAGGQGRVAVADHRLAHEVDGGEDLGAGAEVAGQREARRRRGRRRRGRARRGTRRGRRCGSGRSTAARRRP